jgi:hypothetical protein
MVTCIHSSSYEDLHVDSWSSTKLPKFPGFQESNSAEFQMNVMTSISRQLKSSCLLRHVGAERYGRYPGYDSPRKPGRFNGDPLLLLLRESIDA